MTTTPAFHSLIEIIEAFVPGEDSPEETLALIAQTYGMSHAAYLGIDLPYNRTGKHSIFLDTYPKLWIERYLAQNYIERDPTVLNTRNSTLPLD